MVTLKTVSGLNRHLFNLKLNAGIFFYYLPFFLKGKITLKQFYSFLMRLLVFSKTLKENKFVEVNGKVRTGLYIPAYKTKPYYTACGKFLEFDRQTPPITVLFSVTSACRYNCEHCYQKRDRGKDIDVKYLIDAARTMQDMGMAYFIIEGGEPFLVFDKLKALMEAIDDRSEIWVNTTGEGVTREQIRELKQLGLTALQFSMHSPDPDTLNSFMGSDNAWSNLEQGVTLAYEEGVPVSFNMCLPKENFHDGTFEKIMDQVKAFKGFIIQVIHPKSSGGWLEGCPGKFSAEDYQRVRNLVHKYNFDPEYRDYPAISAQIMEEDPEVFGCTAGGTDRFYINAKGDVQPCEFLNISFGNLAQEDFSVIFERMRGHFSPPGEMWMCDRYSRDIATLYQENGLDTLPLSVDLSRQVYENWDNGKPTKFYENINRLR